MYLGNGYYLDADRYQYILEKHVISKKGKSEGEEIVSDSTFHPTVHAACEALLRRLQRGEVKEFKNNPEDTVKAFEKHLEEVRDMFKRAEHLKLEGE